MPSLPPDSPMIAATKALFIFSPVREQHHWTLAIGFFPRTPTEAALTFPNGLRFARRRPNWGGSLMISWLLEPDVNKPVGAKKKRNIKGAQNWNRVAFTRTKPSQTETKLIYRRRIVTLRNRIVQDATSFNASFARPQRGPYEGCAPWTSIHLVSPCPMPGNERG